MLFRVRFSGRSKRRCSEAGPSPYLAPAKSAKPERRSGCVRGAKPILAAYVDNTVEVIEPGNVRDFAGVKGTSA